jgi:hypothetical protein
MLAKIPPVGETWQTKFLAQFFGHYIRGVTLKRGKLIKENYDVIKTVIKTDGARLT